MGSRHLGLLDSDREGSQVVLSLAYLPELGPCVESRVIDREKSPGAFDCILERYLALPPAQSSQKPTSHHLV